MQTKLTNINFLIRSILPNHIVAKYPRLVEFAEYFFEYLSKENKSAYYQNSLYQQRDIRVQDHEFLNLIQRELGLLSKKNVAADPKVFYDYLSNLWTAKGSEESIKTFFRIFLDDEITIYYPWEAVLIPSSGIWKVEKVLRVSMISGDPLNFVGKTVKQLNRAGSAVISKVEKAVYRDGIIYELHLINSSIVPKFVEREEIYAVEDSSLRAEIYRSVVDLEIIERGSGYESGDLVEVFGYNGLSFKGYVLGVDSNGGILDIAIVNFGSGNTPDHVLNSDNPPTFAYKDFYIYKDGELISAIEPTVVVQSTNGSGTNIKIKYGTIADYPGYYDGVKGQLSQTIVLQDSNYYQKFSYEVTTNYSNKDWEDALKKTVHPSGMAVFSNIKTFFEQNISVNNSFIFARSKDPVNYTMLEKPDLTSTATGLIQDYVYNSDVDLNYGTDIYFAEDYVGVLVFSESDTVAGESTNTLVDTIVTVDI